MKRFVLVLLLAALGPAGAVTVYRCGADGRSYSDTPCADAREVAVDDARSAAQVSEAQRIAAVDRRLAERQSAERRMREAQSMAATAAPGQLTVPPAADRQSATHPAKRLASRSTQSSTKSTASKARRQRPAPEATDTFRAAAPSSRRAPG